MEEKDVGACDSWPVAYDWAQSGIPPSSRTVITTNSKLGKKCHNPKIHKSKDPLLDDCEEPYFFDINGQQNVYSNFNNMAHVIENCRFACAIDVKCLGIEFVKGSLCALVREYRNDKVVRHLGTLTERKPVECVRGQKQMDIYWYPYRKALTYLHRQAK
ncbi:hypothetical protein AAHC03_026618 [Spirometra sp. Aus1]